MASITRRGDLQWQARVRRKGYPVQIKTFNMRAEAEAWARLMESEIDRGVFVSRAEAESTTLAEALDRYDREIAASKKGYVQEASLLRMWKSTVIASRPMASVRSADIAKLRDDWLKQTNPPLKPASVVRRLAVLSHVFSIARKEWTPHSQCEGREFDPPPLHQRNPKGPIARSGLLFLGSAATVGVGGTVGCAAFDVRRKLAAPRSPTRR